MYSIFEQLLQKYGVSTYKVSKDTGIAQSVFSAWKNGISTPKQDKIQKIADYFNVSVDYLLGRVDVKTPIPEILGDNDMISLQRAREKMPQRDREQMMKIVRGGFDYAFIDEDN